MVQSNETVATGSAVDEPSVGYVLRTDSPQNEEDGDDRT